MSSSATQAPPAPSHRPAHAPPQAPPPALSIDPIRLLKRHKIALVASVIVGVILGVLTYIPLQMFAKQFTAFVLFEAKPAIEDSSVVGSGTTGTGGSGGLQEMGLFMQTQVADMLGESLRTQLANHPNFRDTELGKSFADDGNYNAADAVDAIEDRLTAGVVPETTYIQLRFRAGAKADAATIANTAANTYMTRLRQRTNAQFEEALVSITSRLRTAELQLRQKEAQMQRLLGDNELESLDSRLSDAHMTVASLSPAIAEMQNALESLQDRLVTFEEMRSSPEGVQYPEEVRTMVTQHPTIAGYDQMVASLRAELRTMRSRFGPNHMTVKQIEQRIAGTLDQKAAEEQRLLAEMFVTFIEATRTQIASTEAMLREANASRDTAVLRMQEITRALSEYNRLDADADLLAQQIGEYRVELQNTEALRNRTSTASRMLLVQEAAPPSEPSFPKIIIVVPVVTFLTVALVGGVIFLRELLEQRVRMPADVQLINRARLLGVVPDISEDPSKPTSIDTALRDRPDGVIAEQVRQIRTSIAKARGAHDGGYAILVIGGMPGAGASSVIAALAQSYAAMGDRTLVIDANLRKPLMHQYLSLADAPGLSDCLAGGKTLDEAVQKMAGDYPVHLLAAGSRSARVYERLNSQKMTELVADARSKYDIVLIDAPPMVVSNDGIVLATKADASILVVKAFQETRGLIGRVVAQLMETRAQHLGIIVNGVKAAAGGYYRRNFRLAHRYNAESSAN